MNNMPEENLNGGGERAPNSKFKQLWRSIIKRAPKERSLRRDPHPQVDGISELPGDQQIPVSSSRPQSPQELDLGRACSPPRVGRPRGSDQQPTSSQHRPRSQHRPSSRRASRRLSGVNFPISQEQDFIDRPPVPAVDTTGYSSQPPRERGPRRVRSQPQVHQSRESNQPQEPNQPRIPDPRRVPRRLSGHNHSDRGIVIAVMGITGKSKAHSKPAFIG